MLGVNEWSVLKLGIVCLSLKFAASKNTAEPIGVRFLIESFVHRGGS